MKINPRACSPPPSPETDFHEPWWVSIVCVLALFSLVLLGLIVL